MLPAVETVVSITGVFDSQAAARLRAACMESARKLSSIVVDFSRASEVTDVALAILIEQQAASEEPRLILRGLTQRHNRMLRYLGSYDQAVAG